MNVELLTTIAECAIGFAGFSALAVIIPQLAGIPWHGGMATGLWLMVSWALTAFAFALLPLVLGELGLETGGSLRASSGLLAIAILGQGILASRRDAARGHPLPRIARAARATAIGVAVVMLGNGAGLMPGGHQGWYLLGLLSLFLLAAAPLSVFLAALSSDG